MWVGSALPINCRPAEPGLPGARSRLAAAWPTCSPLQEGERGPAARIRLFSVIASTCDLWLPKSLYVQPLADNPQKPVSRETDGTVTPAFRFTKKKRGVTY